MHDADLRKPEDIWNDETGETVGQAMARFRSFGPLIDAATALTDPHHIDDEFWSFGYGDDPQDFTTITVSEMLDNLSDGSTLADLDREWGPFVLHRRFSPWTVNEAVERITSRLEAFEGGVGRPLGMSREMRLALDTIETFVKQVQDHGSTDLEWGEPGSCWERLTTDDDIADEFMADHEGHAWHDDGDVARENYTRWAISKGLGRHYGDPHCIWCLQAS